MSHKPTNSNQRHSLSYRISTSFEHGFYGHLAEKIEEDLLFEAQKGIRVFSSREEFVAEFDTIAIVQIGNFENLFISFAAFSLLLLLCFLVRKGRRKLKKALRKLKNALRKVLRKVKVMLSSLANFNANLWNRSGESPAETSKSEANK